MSDAVNKLSLENQIAIITGGGSGVGLETARLLIAGGCRVLLVGSQEQKLQNAAPELASDRVHYFAGDVRNSTTANNAIEQAQRKFGSTVDILVNSAGTILRADGVATSDQEWSRVLDINVNGVFFFCRAFAQQENVNHGAIVTVSSTCGEVGSAGLTAYCASKGAVNQITRALAVELAPRNITVNAVAPGAINSPMLYSKHGPQVTEQSVVDRNIAAIPIGAIAEPQEVARSIVFLATERHITGTILNIDGGYTAQ